MSDEREPWWWYAIIGVYALIGIWAIHQTVSALIQVLR